MPEKKVPCPVCPYKLGIIRTFVSPCPQCRLNGYSFYYKQTKARDNLSSAKPGK